MFKQPKTWSLVFFILALLNVGVSFYLISVDWFQWQISIDETARTGYRIEIISRAFHGYLNQDIFPYENITIHSPKGICLGELSAKWEMSNEDVEIQDEIARWFDLGVLLSPIVVIITFANLLWRWWDKRYFVIFVPFGVCLLLVVMRLLGPRISTEPDFSLYDFNCTYLLAIKAELVSVSRMAIGLFVFMISVELVTIVGCIQSFLMGRKSV